MNDRLARTLSKSPLAIRRKVEPMLEIVALLRAIKSPAVAKAFLPSFARGFVLKLGQLPTADIVSGHAAHFDFRYESNFPEMRELYRRAKQNQWDAEEVIDWSVDVDPYNPEVPLLPEYFIDFSKSEEIDVTLNQREKRRLLNDAIAWMFSQFLHGEQGALYAAAQVTESVSWLDGKLYGATQVMDEGRHVEIFHRYLDEKIDKIYIINDNLFTIIDSLIGDSRWDMKFLGMQIMVEGLALGAFSTVYRVTKEPLLKSLLRLVIQDEARHVHYGVLALREHFLNNLSPKERREREDWAFEVALLMRDRFMFYEIYEEWFEHKCSRYQWRKVINAMPGVSEFRSMMFERLIPNLRAIGLMSPRIQHHYAQAGLLHYKDGLDAMHLDEMAYVDHLDAQPELMLGAAE